MARALDPQAKAKRQKIVAAVGGVILVILLVWRVPPMIALMNKKAPPPPVTASAPAPVPGLPVAASAAPTASGTLADTDTALAPEAGQLVSFGRFVSKDPFAQQIGAAKTGEPTTASSPGRPRKPIKVPSPELHAHPHAPAQPAKPATASAARISVDGKSQSVAVGASFPAADPVFKLVAVGSGSAKIAIDGGSYASGAATHTLRKGEPVTLVNTADGTRYRLLLL